MYQNQILALLVRRHPKLLRDLPRQEFISKDVLIQAGESIDHVIFPTSGLLAVAVTTDGDFVGTGMVGAEGIVGASVVFGAERHLNFVIGRLPGSAYLIPAKELIDLAQRDGFVRRLFFVCEAWLCVQAQQLSACNARHKISQRMSSWLLRAADAIGAADIPATQDLIAEALGVQRASISNIASEFQEAGLIAYARGKIRIVDREALEQQACECHKRLDSFRRTVLGTAG
jgi:CRP-like cAMP-binding protein